MDLCVQTLWLLLNFKETTQYILSSFVCPISESLQRSQHNETWCVFMSKHYSIRCVGHCKQSSYLCEVPEGNPLTAYFFYLTAKQNRHMYQLFDCKTCNCNLFFMHRILFNIFKLNAKHPPCSAPFQNNFYRHRKKTRRKHICLGHFLAFFWVLKKPTNYQDLFREKLNIIIVINASIHSRYMHMSNTC